MSRYPGNQPPPRQPPVSFKTVPGRNRTQKWNEAKTYNYDGDDWGGFDPYDEYGGQEEPDQDAPPHPGVLRQQSFEAGSERRQFSAPTYPAERRASPAMSAGSGYASDHDRRRMRDHQDPGPPLPAQPQGTHSPPSTVARKPSATSIDSASGSKSPDKPLPFIRPSDIYKRMAEEKEKERLSLESSRPSMDSLQREGTPNSGQRPLSTVQERPGSGDASALLASAAGAQSDVPMSSARQPESVASVPHNEDLHSPSHDRSPDLRSIVQGAFTRPDTEHSSQDTRDGDVTRSNTDSTSAISPIMSRIPSSAAAAQREQIREFPVSPIAEEPGASSHSRTVSAETMVPSRYQMHNEPLPSTQKSTFTPAIPSPGNSPARTPDLNTVETRRFSGPMAAQVDVTSPVSPLPNEQADSNQTITGRPRRDTDYSIREADLAREASTVDHVQPEHDIAAEEQKAQSDFLSGHPASGAPLQREWSFDASPSLQPGTAEVLSVPKMPAATERQNSFQPQLPGQWVSAAPTPALEERPPLGYDTTASNQQSRSYSPVSSAGEEPDFSPVSPRKDNESVVTSAVHAVRDAGAALGASLLSTAGNSHQDRDFGSSASSSNDLQHSQSRGPSGNVYISSHPPLNRELSSALSESNTSFTSDRPPTPPAKDLNTSVFTPRDRDATPQALPAIDVHSPLRNVDADSPDDVRSTSSAESASDFESDRLRRDIVKSLDMSNDAAARSAHTGGSAGTSLEDRIPRAAAQISARPGLLDQRFSWETQLEPPQAANQPPIAVVGELPGDEDRQSYERPETGEALHVTNVPREELQSPLVEPVASSEIQALPQMQTSTEKLEVPQAGTDRNELSPSPASMIDSTHIPSYYANLNDDSLATPQPQAESPLRESESQPSRPATASAEQSKLRNSGRIPPFREILALKSPPERIQAYHDTRQTFASMDTGLQDWLTTVFASYPEHESLKAAQGQPFAETTMPDGARGHKYNASLLKMKQRSSNPDAAGKMFPNVTRNSDIPPATPPKDITMEKMQAKGKDIMKSAGVLGGKAQAGAKGLFAKGKSRFARGDKAPKRSYYTSEQPAHASPAPVSAAAAREQSDVGEDTRSAIPVASTTTAAPATDSNKPNPAPPPVDDVGDRERSRKRDSFFAQVRRRSKSFTRSRSRPSSAILLSSPDLALQNEERNGDSAVDDASPSSETLAARMRRRSRSMSRRFSRPLSAMFSGEDSANGTPASPSMPAGDFGQSQVNVNDHRRSRSRSLTQMVSDSWNALHGEKDREAQRAEAQSRASSRPQSTVIQQSWSHTPIEAVPPVNFERYRHSIVGLSGIEAVQAPDTAQTEDASSGHDNLVSADRTKGETVTSESIAEDTASMTKQSMPTDVQPDRPRAEEVKDQERDNLNEQPTASLASSKSEKPHLVEHDAVAASSAFATDSKTEIDSRSPEHRTVAATDKAVKQARRTSDITTLPSQLRALELAKKSSADTAAWSPVLDNRDDQLARLEPEQINVDGAGTEKTTMAADPEPAAYEPSRITPAARTTTVESAAAARPAVYKPAMSEKRISKQSVVELATYLPSAVHSEQSRDADYQLPAQAGETSTPQHFEHSASKPLVAPTTVDAEHGSDASDEFSAAPTTLATTSVASDNIQQDVVMPEMAVKKVDEIELPNGRSDIVTPTAQAVTEKSEATQPLNDQPNPSFVQTFGHAPGELRGNTADLPASRILPIPAEPARPRMVIKRKPSMASRRSSQRRRPVPSRAPTNNGTETPLEEKLDRSFATSTFAIDLSNLGKPRSTPQLSQHPALRDLPSADLPVPKQAQVSVKPVVESTPSRHSVTGMPSTRQITDQYGLENVATTSFTEEPAPAEASTTKQRRRRSSVWENFRRSRTSLDPGTKDERMPGPLPPQIQQVEQPQPRQEAQDSTIRMVNTRSEDNLKRPSRASATVETTEVPKKRFSGLGSLFGRSKEPTLKSSKSGKLSKKSPPKQSSPTRSELVQPTLPRLYENTRPDYAAYEASRRRHSQYLQEQSLSAQDDAQLGALQPSRSRGAPVFEPGHAWYGHFVNSVHQYPDPQPQQAPYRPSDNPDGLSYHKVRGHGLERDLEHGPADLMSHGRAIEPQSGRRESQGRGMSPLTALPSNGQPEQQAYAHEEPTQSRPFYPDSAVSHPAYEQRGIISDSRERRRSSQPAYEDAYARTPERGNVAAQMTPNGHRQVNSAFDFGFDSPSYFQGNRQQMPAYYGTPGHAERWPQHDASPHMRGVSYPGQEWDPVQS